MAAYVILGINCEGKKEVLTIQIGENESAKYWLSILDARVYLGLAGASCAMYLAAVFLEILRSLLIWYAVRPSEAFCLIMRIVLYFSIRATSHVAMIDGRK